MGIQSNEQGERLVRSAEAPHARVIAYQLGVLYPRFPGAQRDALALIFERHGFTKAAERIRDIDDARALAAVVSSVGGSRRDGIKVDLLEADTADQHVRAWGIYRVERRPGERQSTFRLGARVFSSPSGVFAASPVDSSEIPECRAVADDLAARAAWLVKNADASAISRAILAVVDQAHVYGFISRGSYVARAGIESTDRLLACFADIRAAFYDPDKRQGLRCSAVAVTAHDSQALSDAVIDDAEARVADLVATLRHDAASGTTLRATTLQRHRNACAEVLAALAPVRDLLGTYAERIESLVNGIHGAYEGATEASELSVPGWVADFAPSGETSPTPSEPASAPAPAPAVAEALTEDAFTI